jgi:hypothetical protein
MQRSRTLQVSLAGVTSGPDNSSLDRTSDLTANYDILNVKVDSENHVAV